MKQRGTSSRLERRAERAARQLGSAPRPYRQRGSRTPVRVKSGSRFNWNIVLGAVAVGLVIAAIAYVVVQSSTGTDSQPSWLKAELDDSPDLPGQYIKPHPGADGVFPSSDDRIHFGTGVKWPICTKEQIDSNQIGECYTTNPPTSGPHSGQPSPFKVLENPQPKENMLHSMEHGGVVVWYNTDDEELVKQLAAVVNGELDRRKLVVMTKYTEMEPNTIALTSWTRLDKFPASDFTKKRIQDFIEKHSRRFNPEGL